MRQLNHPVQGAGLGLRRSMLSEFADGVPAPVAFLEVAPENWMDLGGRLGRRLRELTAACPFVCHGLSLDLGGTAPLNEAFLHSVKRFLDEHQVRCYSEHLSYCGDEQGYLYDLMPIPFTEEAVHHVAARIRRAQEIVERRIAVENISYYAAPGKCMQEIDFINAVLTEADCDLLLDVNNIYVNGINHNYDPYAFLHALPGERIAYAHVAGHYEEAEDLRIDTHGADVIQPVWNLLEEAYRCFGVFPTLIERDFNIPPMAELMQEVATVERLQRRHAADGRRREAPAQSAHAGA